MNIREAVRSCNPHRTNLLDLQVLSGVTELTPIAAEFAAEGSESIILEGQCADSLSDSGEALKGKIVEGIVSVPKAILLRELYQQRRGVCDRPFPNGLPKWNLVNGNAMVVQDDTPEVVEALKAAGWDADMSQPGVYVYPIEDWDMQFGNQLDAFRALHNQNAPQLGLLQTDTQYSDLDDQRIMDAPCDGFGLPVWIIPGDVGAEVSRLQMAIKKFFKLTSSEYAPDGCYGSRTKSLVLMAREELGEEAGFWVTDRFISRLMETVS